MRKLAALVFPGFQTLDLFGPVELLAGYWGDVELVTVAKTKGPIASRHGQRLCVDATLSESTDYDLLLIPGGDSALVEAVDSETMGWFSAVSQRGDAVLAVCTGTVVLGMSGALDGKRATTNKLDFNATVGLAPNVNWVKSARWVEDGKFFTSSGVSAGMDAALAVGSHLFGPDKAREMADGSEYIWNRDPDDDPFTYQIENGLNR